MAVLSRDKRSSLKYKNMENIEKDNSMAAEEEKYHELFAQKKWWEALNYAREKSLPFDTNRILTALNAIRMAERAAEAQGDHAEADRLRFEYERIDVSLSKD